MPIEYIEQNIGYLRGIHPDLLQDQGWTQFPVHTPYNNLFFPFLQDYAGMPYFKSLILTLENNSLQPSNQNYNNFSSTKLYWETAKHSSKISNPIHNAWTWPTQVLNIYINTPKYDVGYIDDQIVFSKSSINIKSYNILEQTASSFSTIKTFNNFTSKEDDSSRFSTWTVPNPSETAFEKYLLHGCFLLVAELERSYYYDSSFELPFVTSYPSKSYAYLQVLTYSPAYECLTVFPVQGNIITSAIGQNDTLSQIYDKTIFPSLVENINELTEGQKRALIGDQLALLFIGTHPVSTADCAPNSIMGYGGISTLRSNASKERYISQKAQEVEQNIDRLFGIFARPKFFNFVSDISSYFNNHDSSIQYIRDPVRSLSLNTNETINNVVGCEGVIFSPYAFNILNAEIPLDTEEDIIYDLSVSNEYISISNISVKNKYGGQIKNGESSIKVSFEVSKGETYIEKVKYIVFTNNNRNYYQFEDVTGTTRSHQFDLPMTTPIVFSESQGDLIKIRIDIENSFGYRESFYHEEILTTDLPGIYDIDIKQRQDGSGLVNIEYLYKNYAETINSYVSMQFSIDNGNTWIDISGTQMKGDYGYGVMPGLKRIVWNPLLDTTTGHIPLKVKINLIDIDENSNVGYNTSGTLLYDKSKPQIAVRRVEFDQIADLLVSSSSSSTSSSDTSSSETSLSTSSTSESTESLSSSSSSSSSSNSSSSSSSSSIDSSSTSSTSSVSSRSSSSGEE